MKSVSKTIATTIRVMCAPLLLLAFVACGKSSDNNNSTVAAVQYGVLNGTCYDITHNTPMPSNSYCSGTNGQYIYSGNQCVLASNPAQIVDPSYCQNGGLNGLNNSYYGNGGYQQYYGGGGTIYYPFGTSYASQFGANYYPSTYGGGSYQGTEVCTGQYYQTNGFTAQLMTCGFGGCHGLFLTSVRTHQRVLCN